MANIDNSIRIAAEFIKKWEKLSSSSATVNKIISSTVPDSTIVHSYYDSVGNIWTIGWGNTYYANGSKVKSGDTITKAEADKLLLVIVKEKEAAIRSSIPYQKLTDNQYAALISIAYNAGQGNFKSSQIDDAINQGKSDAYVSNLIKDSIVTSRGVFVQSLKNRRVDESKLYDGSYNQLYSYYLRNEKNVNYALLGGLLLVVTAASYWYYKKSKR
jgi:lysozyme